MRGTPGFFHFQPARKPFDEKSPIPVSYRPYLGTLTDEDEVMLTLKISMASCLTALVVYVVALFSVIDANGWAIIIAAIALGAGQITSMILTYYRDIAKEKRIADQEAAKEARAAEEAKRIEDKADAAALRIEMKADAAARAVREVKSTLADTTALTTEKLEGLAKVTDTIHALGNSAMLEQKRLLAVSARALALAEPTEANSSLSKSADQNLAEHERSQIK